MSSTLIEAPPFADATAESGALIDRGVELRRQHDDVAALAKFKSAYALEPSARCRAQIALAEQSLGRWIEAETDLRAALSAADPWILRHQAALEQALGFVQTHLAWLNVDTNVQGADVTLNGGPMGTAPMTSAVRVVVGSILLRVSASSYTSVERVIAVESSEHARAFIELVPLGRPPLQPDAVALEPILVRDDAKLHAGHAATTRRRPPLSWGGVALTSLGVAGLGIGTFYGVRVLVDKSKRDEHCSDQRCDALGGALDDEARRDAVSADVALAAGAASALLGIVILWRASAGSAVSPGIALVPHVAHEAASLEITGPW